MKKRGLLFVTASLALLTLASCNNSGSPVLDVHLPELEGFTFTTSQEKAVVGTEFSLTVTNSSPTTKKLKSVTLNGTSLEGYSSGNKTLYTFTVPEASELNFEATAAALYGVSSTNLVLDGLTSTTFEAGETVTFTPYLKSVETLETVLVKTGTTTVATTKSGDAYSFTMPAGDVVISGVASVTPTYDVITPDDLEGFIFTSSVSDAKAGDTVKVTITQVPNTDYLLSNVKVYGSEVELLTDGEKGVFYFEMKDADAVITASEELLYKITVASDLGIDVDEKATAGSTIIFTLPTTAIITDLTILDGDGQDVDYTLEDRTVTFTMPASNVAITGNKEEAHDILSDVLHAMSFTGTEIGGKATVKTSSYASGVYNYSYEIGNDSYGSFWHITKAGAWSTEEYYLGVDADGNDYEIQKSGDAYAGSTTVLTDEARTGLKYDLHSSNATTSVYGTKGLLDVIYNGVVENAFDSVSVDETLTGYHATFYSLVTDTAGTYLFTYDATIELASGLATKISIDTLGYRATEYDLDLENNTVEIHDGASIGFTRGVSVELSYGAKTATHDYDYESFFYDDFELLDATTLEAIPESFTIESGYSGRKEMVLSSTSTTASAKIDTPKITTNPSSGISANYSSYNNKITINGSVEGTYEVTIATKNASKTLQVSVVLPAPTEVSYITAYASTGDSYDSSDVLVTDGEETQVATVEIYEGSTIYLAPGFNPYNADGSFTGTVIDSGEGGITCETTSIEVWYESISVYAVTGNTTGTYTIKLASAVDPNVAVTVTVKVVAKPTIDDIVAKMYGYTMRAGMGSPEQLVIGVEFDPSEEDANFGEVTIYDYHNMQMGGDASTTTYKYEFASATNEFILKTLEDENALTSLTLSDTYDLVFNTYDDYGEESYLYSQKLSELTASMITGTSFSDYETGYNLYFDYATSTAELANYTESYQCGTFTFTATVTGLKTVEFAITNDDSVCQAFGFDSIDSMIFDFDTGSITLTVSITDETETTQSTITVSIGY